MLLNLSPQLSIVFMKHSCFTIIAQFRLRWKVRSEQRNISFGRIVKSDDSVGRRGLIVVHQCVNQNNSFELYFRADWLPGIYAGSDGWYDQIECRNDVIRSFHWMSGFKANELDPEIQIID